MSEPRRSVYERVVALKLPIDHHESDLLVPVTPETTAIVEERRAELARFLNMPPNKVTYASVFRHGQYKGLWYDIPFAYDPWWLQRRTAAAAP